MGLLQIIIGLQHNNIWFLHLPQLHTYIFTLSIFTMVTKAKLSFMSSPIVVECAWTMCLRNTIAPSIWKMQKKCNFFL